MSNKFVVWFEQVGKQDIELVGGKGANLGEMTKAHIPIPYGFIITSQAYYYFLKVSNLENKIEKILSILNFENNAELEQAAHHIQELILRADMPHSIAREIVEYYDNLTLKQEKQHRNNVSLFEHGKHKLKAFYAPPFVAVRSSATAEDLSDASFAGQQDSYLNVKGDVSVVKKVKECWASLFNARAIYYRHQQNYDHVKIGLAVIIERMIQSEKSGIGFSIDPITNDKNKMVIEAIFGLGEHIVQGKVTPDHYEVDKRSFVILKKETHFQNHKFVKSHLENKQIALSREVGSLQKLSDKEIESVAILIKDIEDYYVTPQDIEWAIENERIYILQSRPITTIQTNSIQLTKKQYLNHSALQLPLLIGSPASPGIGVGHVQIIHSPKQVENIKKGDVLVAAETNPDYVMAIKKASAIITETGGSTSHAAIVSRELGIPAVVGAKHATTILKNGMVVSVNGKSGQVFKGSILSSTHHEIKNFTPLKNHSYKTITRLYVNLAEPHEAEQSSHMDVDGIGLLQAEAIIKKIGEHPKEFIKEKKEHIFINKLAHNLEVFAEAFSPKPILYRSIDFKTSEYRQLIGGERYEPTEENPMLGLRGASRYIANPDVFGLELQAIKQVWDKGYRNIHLMIPFLRAPWELIKIKNIMNEYGISTLPGFKLWIMIEVPATALQLEEFIKIGVDGVSIGTNNLTMMVMGVDKENKDVANMYDERTPAVMMLLEQIVSTCAKAGIQSSICGQGVCDYPEIVEKLVEKGITSVSVTPNAVQRTREVLFNIEKKVFNNFK